MVEPRYGEAWHAVGSEHDLPLVPPIPRRRHEGFSREHRLAETLMSRGDLTGFARLPRFEVYNRRTPGALLWTGGIGYRIASQEILDVLRQVGATGWFAHPVQIRHRDGSELRGYSMLFVTGVCPPLWTRTDPASIRANEPTGSWTGRGSRIGSVDGTDVFWEPGPASWELCVTDRVARALRESGLRGFSLQRFSRYAPILHSEYVSLLRPDLVADDHEDVDPAFLDRARAQLAMWRTA